MGGVTDALIAAKECLSHVCTGDTMRCMDGNGCECEMAGNAPTDPMIALIRLVAALSAQPRSAAYQQGYADGVSDMKKSPHYDDSCDTKPQPASAPVGVDRLIKAAEGAEALIGVMFGRADGSMPGSIHTPLGIPVKVGAIAKELRAALARQPAAERSDALDLAEEDAVLEGEQPAAVDEAMVRSIVERYLGKHGRLTKYIMDDLTAALAQQPAAVDESAIRRALDAYGQAMGEGTAWDAMRTALYAALAQPQGANHDE